VNQLSGTTPADARDESRPADTGDSAKQSETGQGGFAARGRMRRRARFLRKARELAYRDLGGLVFNLHRFGQRNDALVMAKLSTLGHIDAELRGLENALRERRGVTVLREAGITACARCAAIHSSEDRFCPNCGLSLGPHADLPIAGAAASPAAHAPPAAASPSPADASPPGDAAAAAPPAQATPAPAAPAPEPSGAEGAREPAAGSETPSEESSKPPSEPVTAVSPAVAVPGRGRAQAGGDTASSAEDEPTEIIRPPSSGR
jgi:hypothetical protein